MLTQLFVSMFFTLCKLLNAQLNITHMKFSHTHTHNMGVISKSKSIPLSLSSVLPYHYPVVDEKK